MSASEIAIRGGQPSITTPLPPPCDSPKVVTRKRWPNVLPIAGIVAQASCPPPDGLAAVEPVGPTGVSPGGSLTRQARCLPPHSRDGRATRWLRGRTLDRQSSRAHLPR